jgi:hypothetical protein
VSSPPLLAPAEDVRSGLQALEQGNQAHGVLALDVLLP